MEKGPKIFSNKMVEIYYDESTKVAMINYRGLVNYDSFDEVIEEVNRISMEFGIIGVVVDMRKLCGSFHRILEYARDTGYPLLIKNGLIAQAQIICDDLILTNLSLKAQKVIRELGVKYEIFHNRSEGEEWLSSFLNIE